MRKKSRTNGFSILEVLIAIGVVATGILALMAVFITGSRSNQHGEDLSKAVFYARKVTEVVRVNALAFTNLPGVPDAASGLNDPVGTFRPLTDAPIQFARIRTPKLTEDAGGNIIVVTDGLGQAVPDVADDKFERSIQLNMRNTGDYDDGLIDMDVTIRWVGGKTGDGLRRVKLSSLLKAG